MSVCLRIVTFVDLPEVKYILSKVLDLVQLCFVHSKKLQGSIGFWRVNFKYTMDQLVSVNQAIFNPSHYLMLDCQLQTFYVAWPKLDQLLPMLLTKVLAQMRDIIDVYYDLVFNLNMLSFFALSTVPFFGTKNFNRKVGTWLPFIDLQLIDLYRLWILRFICYLLYGQKLVRPYHYTILLFFKRMYGVFITIDVRLRVLAAWHLASLKNACV